MVPSPLEPAPDTIGYTLRVNRSTQKARRASTAPWRKSLPGTGLESGRREELKEWFAAAVKILMTSRNLPKEL